MVPVSPSPSREAAKEYSPRRKPWVGEGENDQAPEGRKKSHYRVAQAFDLVGTTSKEVAPPFAFLARSLP